MISKPKARFPKQGEIWLVKFPKSKESRKPFRPFVIIRQNEHDEEVVVMPLTAEEVIAGEVQSFEILVKINQETGLNKPSRILTNRIHTIDKELRLVSILGKINQDTWEKLLISLWEGITGQKGK